MSCILIEVVLCQTLFVCVKLYLFVSDFICSSHLHPSIVAAHSTVTDFARLRGLSTSVPRASAV